MDRYTECVTKLRCDDKVGLAACVDESVNRDETGCGRLGAYLVACGLEPASGTLSCSEYGGVEDSAAFAQYAQCVVEKGCLSANDAAAALDECRQQLLGNVEENLDACQHVVSRAQVCGEDLPTLTTCTLQVAGFTVDSVAAWATCYVQAPCGDFSARAECSQLFEIDPGSNNNAKVACEKISVFQVRCGLIALPVIGDRNTCQAALNGFEPEQSQAFADCLSPLECNDGAGIAACAAALTGARR